MAVLFVILATTTTLLDPDLLEILWDIDAYPLSLSIERSLEEIGSMMQRAEIRAGKNASNIMASLSDIFQKLEEQGSEFFKLLAEKSHGIQTEENLLASMDMNEDEVVVVEEQQEEEWEWKEQTPLKAALEQYSQELFISEAKARANYDCIDALTQSFKMQVGEIFKQLVQYPHEAQFEKNLVWGIVQDEDEVVVDSTMLAKESEISALDKYVGLHACVEIGKLTLSTCLSNFLVKMPFDPLGSKCIIMVEEVNGAFTHWLGGVEDKVILLLQSPLQVPFDPGGGS